MTSSGSSAPLIDQHASVDVLIVGDGLVGRPLALALADSGHAVALVDRNPVSDNATPAEQPLNERCTAFSVGTVDWLERHRLWFSEAAAAEPIKRVHVSQMGHFGSTRIEAAEIGREALGWTVENRCFTRSLRARLDASNVQRLPERVVHSVERDAEAVTVRLAKADSDIAASGIAGSDIASSDQVLETLSARLLIIADGVESDTGHLLGIESTHTSHAQFATLTTVELDREHRGVARERFTPGGPLAVLPRKGRCASIVACHTSDEAQSVAALDEQGFSQWLDERLPARAGRVMAVGPRIQLPLQRIEAKQQYDHRVVLVGNAARLLHPVAGQGYNLAVRDIAALVDALDGAQDPGDMSVLAEWALSRRADQKATVTLTDTLARVFRGQSRALGHVRATALANLDLIAPLRRRFAQVTTRGHLS